MAPHFKVNGTYYSLDNVPSCPVQVHSFGFPSTTIVFAAMTFLSIVAAVFVAIKYNSVKVFNRRVSEKIISNTFWIMFYCAVALRFTAESIRFGLHDLISEQLDNYFLWASLGLQAAVALVLSLALNFQRRYRSAPSEPPPVAAAPAPPPFSPYGQAQYIPPPRPLHRPHASVPNSPAGENVPPSSPSDPLLPNKYSSPSSASSGNHQQQQKQQQQQQQQNASHHHQGAADRFLDVFDLIFVVLFLAQVGFLVTGLWWQSSTVLYALYMASFGLQRIPFFVLLLYVLVMARRYPISGPSASSRMLLAAGIALTLFDMPVVFWAALLPDKCIFTAFSLMDLMELLYGLSLLCFFLFLRGEYLRNMEECIWKTVNQIQDTFDFRRF